MKKFLVLFFIFLVLGGAAFFFGWTQFAVPPGYYGVMRSKTHGLDGQLIRDGEFRWVWYKLIPGNVSIVQFQVKPKDYFFTIKNSLPSGEVYALFSRIKADFSYELTASVSFSIKPEALPGLVLANRFDTQEDLAAFEEKTCREIESFILKRLAGGGESDAELEQILSQGSSEHLDADVLKQFPFIEHFSCVVHSADFPDFTLYRSVKGIYEDYLAKQREYLSSSLNLQAENRIEAQLRFDELSRYGELLTKYPVLLQYLALEKGLPGPAAVPDSGE
jgi:hypothetical protein